MSPGNGQLDVGDQVKLIVYASNCSPGAAAHEGTRLSGCGGCLYAGPDGGGYRAFDHQAWRADHLRLQLCQRQRRDCPEFRRARVCAQNGRWPNTTFDTGSIPANCSTPPAQGEIIDGTKTPPVRRGDYILCTVGATGMLNDGQSGSFNVTFNVPATASIAAPINIVNNGDYNISAVLSAPTLARWSRPLSWVRAPRSQT